LTPGSSVVLLVAPLVSTYWKRTPAISVTHSTPSLTVLIGMVVLLFTLPSVPPSNSCFTWSVPVATPIRYWKPLRVARVKYRFAPTVV
jgi:hypothetical protein